MLQAIIPYIPQLAQQPSSQPQAASLNQAGGDAATRRTASDDPACRRPTSMKDEHGESSPCGSPFIQEIQDTPILQHFHLLALEAYDSGSNPMEHVTAFMAHMALYGMSNAIMC
ncbi:hypothetical protein B296_00031307 [Ensete ventricosum]|uniref:Uncharacterized protein n=1 Tax=Ensete ventricosum TaxID=4639 RepID=A0A426YKW8_ENSVE|nr:hypothetical protein B296_00031307 [Ensete ventricosum]